MLRGLGLLGGLGLRAPGAVESLTCFVRKGGCIEGLYELLGDCTCDPFLELRCFLGYLQIRHLQRCGRSDLGRDFHHSIQRYQSGH